MFIPAVAKKLKFYIYIYIDQRDNSIFYVGKGKNNRAFSHLVDNNKSEKVQRIREIYAAGLEPKIEILIHGIIKDDEIKRIEASIIDLIGIGNLSNIQRGYGSGDYGRMSIEQINALYASEEVKVTEPALLININKTFYYGISAIDLYDSTRAAWSIGKAKEKVEYAFAVYQGIVKEVYSIQGWFPAYTTFNTKKPDATNPSEKKVEFIGRLADNDVREKYINKSVAKYMGPRNPINYVNVG